MVLKTFGSQKVKKIQNPIILHLANIRQKTQAVSEHFSFHISIWAEI